MKRLFILLSVICLATVSKAQVFNPTIKLETDISATDDGVITIIEYTGDFVINEHFSIGPGIGIGAAEFFTDPTPKQKYDMVSTLPVFANVKWFFCPKRKVSPFIYGKAGYTFCFNDYYDSWFDDDKDFLPDFIDNTGLNLAFGPGADIALKRGSIQVSLNWNMQKVRFFRPYYTSWVSETLFGLSVGYSWGKRYENSQRSKRAKL